MALVSPPIESVYDERLLGLPAIATETDIPPEVVRWAPWVRSYMAQGRHDLLIARAMFELPPPIEIWEAMDHRTFDGLHTRHACETIALACGWTVNQMLAQTGLAQFSGYPALAVCTLVGIRSARNRVQEFSWRSFAAKVERMDVESQQEKDSGI